MVAAESSGEASYASASRFVLVARARTEVLLPEIRNVTRLASAVTPGGSGLSVSVCEQMGARRDVSLVEITRMRQLKPVVLRGGVVLPSQGQGERVR